MTVRAVSDVAAVQRGGLCALLGGAGYIGVGVAHGNLPTETVEEALRYVADMPMWHLIHLCGIVAIFFWVAAIASLRQSLPAGKASGFGDLATVAAIVGAALFCVDYTIDGIALKQVADVWASGGHGTGSALRSAAVILAILDATVKAGTTWTFGPPILLLGLALRASRRTPRWLPWPVIVSGAVGMLAGIVSYLAPDVEAPFLLTLASSAVTALWLVALGVVLMRPAGARRLAGDDVGSSE